MAFKSIRSRLTAWYVTLLAIILILFSIFLNYFLSKRLYESIDNSLTVSAKNLERRRDALADGLLKRELFVVKSAR